MLDFPMQLAKFKLTSTSLHDLQEICEKIKTTCNNTGIALYGPVPLPTRKLQVSTQKSPCGQGTTTWENYTMKIHKRLVKINADERSMTQVLKIPVPDSVHVEIILS